MRDSGKPAIEDRGMVAVYYLVFNHRLEPDAEDRAAQPYVRKVLLWQR